MQKSYHTPDPMQQIKRGGVTPCQQTTYDTKKFTRLREDSTFVVHRGGRSRLPRCFLLNGLLDSCLISARLQRVSLIISECQRDCRKSPEMSISAVNARGYRQKTQEIHRSVADGGDVGKFFDSLNDQKWIGSRRVQHEVTF